MKVELYGCNVCGTVVALPPDTKMAKCRSVQQGPAHAPSQHLECAGDLVPVSLSVPVTRAASVEVRAELG